MFLLTTPENYFIVARFAIRFRHDFWPVLAEIFPPRCPFFSPPSFWPIFLFPGYLLVMFWFVCLFLSPPTKVAVKQSGETQGESDCKAERENSRRKSDCNCLLLEPPKSIPLLPSSPLDFAAVFWPVFWLKSARHAALFVSSLFLAYFPVFWLFFWSFFGFFVSS